MEGITIDFESGNLDEAKEKLGKVLTKMEKSAAKSKAANVIETNLETAVLEFVKTNGMKHFYAVALTDTGNIIDIDASKKTQKEAAMVVATAWANSFVNPVTTFQTGNTEDFDKVVAVENITTVGVFGIAEDNQVKVATNGSPADLVGLINLENRSMTAYLVAKGSNPKRFFTSLLHAMINQDRM